jgi:hypothetical protein
VCIAVARPQASRGNFPFASSRKIAIHSNIDARLRRTDLFAKVEPNASASRRTESGASTASCRHLRHDKRVSRAADGEVVLKNAILFPSRFPRSWCSGCIVYKNARSSVA